MNVIETLGVEFRYGKQFSIHDLRLQVEEGDIYGFLGPNGAGKTTTIRLLLGLVKPQQGNIRLFGKDLHRKRLEVLDRVGTHVEGHAFYPFLSGRNNLKLFARYNGKPDMNRIDSLLDLVGLKSAARARVRTYSLGMKQRLGIAQALVTHPDLLILDEPLNGLDPPGVIEVRELLQRLNQEEGVTIFFSSHRLDEAQRICTRIGLIQNGSIVMEGPLESLLAGEDTWIYRIRTTDNAAAYRLLLDTDRVDQVLTVEDSLEVRLSVDESHRVARTLVEAGIDIHELSPWQPSLEDLFRRSLARTFAEVKE